MFYGSNRTELKRNIKKEIRKIDFRIKFVKSTIIRMMEVPKSEYEGAGFILYNKFTKDFVLGVSSTTGELEYMGGKPEGNELPHQTAFNELVEELGGNPLDEDWQTRVQVLHIFQPFSKKWIWCFFLSLSSTELEKVKQLSKDLDSWPMDLEKDFSSITGRPKPARKAITSIVSIYDNDFFNYIKNFTEWPQTKNRMADAKLYGAHESTKLLDGVIFHNYNVHVESKKLRGFNCVIFEQHLDWLKSVVDSVTCEQK